MTIQTTSSQDDEKKYAEQKFPILFRTPESLSLQLLFVVHRIKKISICLKHFFTANTRKIFQ
jgi:hypothetical protein